MTKTKTASQASTYPRKRSQIRSDKFVRLEGFPVDCDSKADECFGHVTDVIRNGIVTRQLIAKYRLAGRMYQTPATTPFDWTSKDEMLPSEPKSLQETHWESRFYKYVAGGDRAGS